MGRENRQAIGTGPLCVRFLVKHLGIEHIAAGVGAGWGWGLFGMCVCTSRWYLTSKKGGQEVCMYRSPVPREIDPAKDPVATAGPMLGSVGEVSG